MAIDTSIYQNIKPVEMPSVSDYQQKALTISHLQNQNQQDDMTMHMQKAKVIGTALESLAGLPPEERAAAYPSIVQGLFKVNAITPNDVPSSYDDGFFKQALGQWHASKDYIDQQKDALEVKRLDQDTRYANEARDPNSDLSKRSQSIISRMGGGVDAQGMSYDQIQKISPLVEKAREADGRIQDRQFVRDQKRNADQDKSYTDLRNHMENFRGNQAAQQAAKDVLSVNKAVEMLDGKDPNSFTTQDLGLIAGEMAKVATGGIPTEHGIQQLMPNNLSTKMAEIQNFLTSKPTDAEAGEYIQKNMSYLKGMAKEAQKTINGFRKNIAKGYQHRVSKQDFNEAMSDYQLNDPPPPSGKIRISNGKETLEISAEDLEHAKADGFQQVK